MLPVERTRLCVILRIDYRTGTDTASHPSHISSAELSYAKAHSRTADPPGNSSAT